MQNILYIALLATAAITGIVILRYAFRGLWPSALRRDREILEEMVPILDRLWDPLRYLADLKAVWDDLSTEERAAIEQSSVHQEAFHENLAAECTAQILALLGAMTSFKYRGLRWQISDLVSNRSTHEPDEVKIILALIEQQVKNPRPSGKDSAHQI